MVRIIRVILVGLLPLAIGCGLEETQTQYGEEDPQDEPVRYAPVKQKRQAQNRELIPIPISVVQTEDSSLGLTTNGLSLLAKASATSYSIDITGCLSGYSQTGITASTVYVYKFDSGCTVELKSLVFDGATYDLTHADAVAWPSSLAVGDTATLVDTTATAGSGNSTDVQRLEAIIDATLTSGGVVDGEAITISFRQIVLGTTENVAVTVVREDTGHTVTVSGQKAPNFTIETVTLRNIDASGDGVWEFTLLCGTELTDSNTKCDDVLLTDITYALVLDTFSGTMNRTELDAAMAGGGSYDAGAGISVISGDVNNTVASTYNGGFSTQGTSGTTYVSIRDTARTNIHTDLNMILILEANDSFIYYNVDVTAVSN